MQQRIGLTNFFIARCFGVVAAGFGVIDLIADYSVPRTSDDYSVGRLLNDAMGLAWLGYVLIIRPEQWEQDFFTTPEVLPIRHLVERAPCRWRPILLTIAVFLPIQLWTMGKSPWMVARSTEVIWVLLSLYFLAVEPLPPGSERVRDDVWGTQQPVSTTN